ncbi:hypothetical protein LTS14_006642 [Recurvomyces mirabilis]|nr:hypothetical protein LTS14_006642 [Recurvomyces mirabilis]
MTNQKDNYTAIMAAKRGTNGNLIPWRDRQTPSPPPGPTAPLSSPVELTVQYYGAS